MGCHGRVSVSPAEAAGEATEARASAVPGALAGRHAELHRARGAHAYRLHAALRLVVRRRHPL